MSEAKQPRPRPKKYATPHQIQTMLDRANRHDVSLTSEEVREFLETAPNLVLVNGWPASRLADNLITRYSSDLIVQESVRLKMEDLRSELAGSEPSPLVALLAERAALCWLDVTARENAAVRSDKFSSPRQEDICQRKIGAAHRRFLAACKTLATVRKLI